MNGSGIRTLDLRVSGFTSNLSLVRKSPTLFGLPVMISLYRSSTRLVASGPGYPYNLHPLQVNEVASVAV